MTCCPPTSILVGNERVLRATFRDSVTGQLVDPSTVRMQVKDPTGVEQSYTPTHVSTGIWTYNFVFSIAGIYVYQFSGSGTYIAVAEKQVVVTESAF